MSLRSSSHDQDERGWSDVNGVNIVILQAGIIRQHGLKRWLCRDMIAPVEENLYTVCRDWVTTATRPRLLRKGPRRLGRPNSEILDKHLDELTRATALLIRYASAIFLYAVTAKH